MRRSFFASRVDFIAILEGFGRPTWRHNSNFGTFFGTLFSNAFRNRLFEILSCFFEFRTLIFVRTASVLEDFYEIEGFLKSRKKPWIWGIFSEAEAEKNQEKIVLRNMRFSDIDFLAVFLDF